MLNFKFFRLKIFINLFILIFVIFFIWIIWQFYLQMRFQLETEVVNSETFMKKIDVLGVLFKDEQVLNYGDCKNALVRNVYSDGEKVARNAEVARKYVSELDIKNLDNLKKIDEKILNLGEIQKIGLYGKNLGGLNKQIYSNYFELLNCLKTSDGKIISTVKDNIIKGLNQKQILIGKVKDFNLSIENLKKKKLAISKLVSSNYKSIATPVSGYFVGSVDGFEQTCCLEKSKEFDGEKLRKLFEFVDETKKVKNCVGKMIINPRIFFKVVFPNSVYIDFKVGSQCTLKFEQTGDEILSELIDFDFGLNKNECVATFEIDCITSQLASLRKSHAQVSFNNYYGLKLNKLAIRKNKENKLGVYVLVGSSLKFKLIDILIEDRNFVISKIHEDNNVYLKELDRVVVKGKNLYDGKRI